MAPAQDDLRDRPIGDLLRELSQETTTLVKQELELAKAAMTQKGKDAGAGAGFIGGGAAVAAAPPAGRAAGAGAGCIGGGALFGLGMFGALTAALVALLATAVDHVW